MSHFGAWLALLVGLPEFQGIRIHASDTAQDTQGCILVGENREKGIMQNSRTTLRRLMKLFDAWKEESCSITVERGFLRAIRKKPAAVVGSWLLWFVVCGLIWRMPLSGSRG